MVEPRFPGWRRIGRLAAWTLGVPLAAILVAGVSFYVAMRVETASNEVTVPDLTGRTSDEATRLAASKELKIEVADQRNDPAVGSGRVLQQDPPAGASVRRGRRVRVVLSLGGKVLVVPELVGRKARQAEIEARREGILPGDESHAYSATVPAGIVLAQVPSAATSAVSGSRLHKLVSDGPEPRPWVMPDLTGRTLQDVQEWIERFGLRRGPVRRVPAPSAMPETVVGQAPLAGYPISSRGVVEITLAQ
jgi:serine/threonine-protein kinase